MFLIRFCATRVEEVTMDEELLKGRVLLIVDDEVDLRDIVASELEFMGATVFQAENITVAQKILEQHKIDLIISDIRMPGGTGLDLLDSVKSKNSNSPPVILITGFADITVEDAFNKGAEALANKPFKLDDLIKMVLRYTSTFEERFKEPGEATKSIESFSNDVKVKFGRGGFMMEITTQGQRYDIGDLVNFDFKFNHMNFKGIGTCRWIKTLDHQAYKALIGVELFNLEDESLKHFQEIYNSSEMVAYIPIKLP